MAQRCKAKSKRTGEQCGAWAVLLTTIETRRRLVDTERRRLAAVEQMITAERAMLLVAALVDAVRRHVDDGVVLAAVAQEVAKLYGEE